MEQFNQAVTLSNTAERITLIRHIYVITLINNVTFKYQVSILVVTGYLDIHINSYNDYLYNEFNQVCLLYRAFKILNLNLCCTWEVNFDKAHSLGDLLPILNTYQILIARSSL